MSAPSSVTKVKIKKGQTNIEYTSDVDAASYYIHELTRAALRDVGKYVAKEFRARYYSIFKKHKGKAGGSVMYKVWSNARTIAPRVQIGLPSSGKKASGFYSFFQEFGSSKTPKLGLLRGSVEENVAKIVEIESQYLSGLSGEASALAAQIDEADMEGGADE